LNPQTQANREVTEGVASRAVKPIAAKRSQDGVFSVEEFWIIPVPEPAAPARPKLVLQHCFP
jgi:hypothetical protein